MVSHMGPFFSFFGNFLYILYFSTLWPKCSCGTNGGFWMCYRHPMTFQKITMLIPLRWGGGSFCMPDPPLLCTAGKDNF